MIHFDNLTVSHDDDPSGIVGGSAGMIREDHACIVPAEETSVGAILTAPK